MTAPPLVVVVAGPNGAGKSTTAPHLLRDGLAVDEFVNADTIAQGLSAFRPDSVALAAGRAMIERLRSLAGARRSFAFETTLASRSFSPWLRALRRQGFRSHIVFISLPTADLAVARVADRVRQGGHDVPEDVVRRRFAAGLANFLNLYRSAVDSWHLYDNSEVAGPQLIAGGTMGGLPAIDEPAAWRALMEQVP